MVVLLGCGVLDEGVYPFINDGRCERRWETGDAGASIKPTDVTNEGENEWMRLE